MNVNVPPSNPLIMVYPHFGLRDYGRPSSAQSRSLRSSSNNSQMAPSHNIRQQSPRGLSKSVLQVSVPPSWMLACPVTPPPSRTKRVDSIASPKRVRFSNIEDDDCSSGIGSSSSSVNTTVVLLEPAPANAEADLYWDRKEIWQIHRDCKKFDERTSLLRSRSLQTSKRSNDFALLLAQGNAVEARTAIL